MKYTGNHFKDLYNIAKEDGLVSALKFDLERTQDDLEGLLEETIMRGVLVVLFPYVIYKTCKMYKKFNKKQSKGEQK